MSKKIECEEIYFKTSDGKIINKYYRLNIEPNEFKLLQEVVKFAWYDAQYLLELAELDYKRNPNEKYKDQLERWYNFFQYVDNLDDILHTYK